jgi:hypothetical protein
MVVTAIILCAIISILGYVGIWVPNNFGAGTLWLYIGILIFMIDYNEKAYEKKLQK